MAHVRDMRGNKVLRVDPDGDADWCEQYAKRCEQLAQQDPKRSAEHTKAARYYRAAAARIRMGR